MEGNQSVPLKNIGNVLGNTIAKRTVLKNENSPVGSLVIGESVKEPCVGKELLKDLQQSSEDASVLEGTIMNIATNIRARRDVPLADASEKENYDSLGNRISLSNESNTFITDKVSEHVLMVGAFPEKLKIESCNSTLCETLNVSSVLPTIRQAIGTDCEEDNENKELLNNSLSGMEGQPALLSGECNIDGTSNIFPTLEKEVCSRENEEQKISFKSHCIESTFPNSNLNIELQQNVSIYNLGNSQSPTRKVLTGSSEVEVTGTSTSPVVCASVLNNNGNKSTLSYQDKVFRQEEREFLEYNSGSENNEIMGSCDAYSETKSSVENEEVVSKSGSYNLEVSIDNVKVSEVKTPPIQKAEKFNDSENDVKKSEENLKKICFTNVGNLNEECLSQILPSLPSEQINNSRPLCDISNKIAMDDGKPCDHSEATILKNIDTKLILNAHSNMKRPNPFEELQQGVKKTKSEDSHSKPIEIDLTEDNILGPSLQNNVLELTPNEDHGNISIDTDHIKHGGNPIDSDILKYQLKQEMNEARIDETLTEENELNEITHDITKGQEKLVNEVIPCRMKENDLLVDDGKNDVKKSLKEMKTIKKEEIDVIELSDDDDTEKSAAEVNNVEAVKNKENRKNENGEKRIPGKSSVDFVSKDPKENDDNNNPEWEFLKKLDSDDERYKAVRMRWRNLVIPDPNKNLTCIHIKSSFKHPNICKNESNWKNENSRSSRKRTHSHEPTTSTDHIPVKRSRTRSCITTYDMKVKNVEREMEEKEKHLEEEKIHALANSQNFYHMQRMFLTASNLQYYNKRDYENQIALLRAEERKAMDALNKNFRAAYYKLEDERKSKAFIFKRAMEEVEAFHKFYRKLDVESTNDCYFLTDVQMDDVVETDRLYEYFDQFYL